MVLIGATAFALDATPAFGQAASDIDRIYGDPIRAYSVSEHIWMTPKYGTDGLVCQMKVYPKRIGPDADYLFNQLPFEELKGVLNHLAPVNTRGAKKEPFGLTATGGGSAWTTYPYTKVTFTFVSSFSVLNSPPLKRGYYVFPVQRLSSNKKLESSLPSVEDFTLSEESSAEIVTIKWNDRKCGG
jgi:hypothetical protein